MRHMDEMMEMMGGMALLWIFALLLLGAVIAVGVYLGVRAGRRDHVGRDSARDLLDRQLAAGEITPEEYYERESVLRASEQGVGEPRRRGRRR